MPRKLGFGLLLAVVTMTGTACVVFHYAGGYRPFWSMARHLSPAYWAILTLLTILFYLMDYVRYYSLFALCGEKLPLRLGLQLTCVSYFVSTLTPGAELYILAVIFLVGRKGISASHAAAVTVLKPFYLTMWVCFIGAVSLGFHKEVLLPFSISHHRGMLMLPFSLLAVIFGYVIFCPERFLKWASSFLSNKGVPWWIRKCVTALVQCAQTISTIGKSTHPMHFLAHAASILFVLVYAAIGSVLAHAVGIPLSPGKALTVFSNSLMVCYLAPSPAGMGITEISTGYLLDPSLSSSAMVVGTFLRFLCWYVVVIPGAIILAYTLNADGLRRLLRADSTPN